MKPTLTLAWFPLPFALGILFDCARCNLWRDNGGLYVFWSRRASYQYASAPILRRPTALRANSEREMPDYTSVHLSEAEGNISIVCHLTFTIGLYDFMPPPYKRTPKLKPLYKARPLRWAATVHG